MDQSTKKLISHALITEVFKNGNSNDVFKLIEQCGFSKVKDNNNNDSLILACNNNHSDLVISLLHLFKDDIAINYSNIFGCTALSFAALNGYSDIVSILLKNGANPNIADVHKKTPLHKSSMNAHYAISNMLIENGANIYAKQHDGKIPFHLCLDQPTLQLFLDYGVNINVMDNDNNTLLHSVCEDSSPNIAKFLISKNANVNIKNNKGNTPLHLACIYNYSDINFIQFLLDNNTDINAQNNKGDTPLHSTAYIELVKLLLLYNINLNLKNNKQATVLDLAITRNDDKMVKVLESYQNYNDLSQRIEPLNNQQILKKLKL